MNVLILTPNGREHALAIAYAKSKKVKKVIMIPGNGLSASHPKIKNHPTIDPMDFGAVLKVCQKEQIDFVDVSQDEIIANGYVDRFQKEGIKTFGPSKKAAEIEWNKAWSRDFMQKYHLPIPLYQVFVTKTKAEQFLKKVPEQPLYIKASGLAAGKGAIYAANKKEAMKAIEAMETFGKSGTTFLIEECMKGEEFSLFVLCDGKHFKILSTAQDHKTIYNNNKGPNTGGMGCVAPSSAITKKQLKEIEKKILTPFMKGMQAEERPYQGILYLGGMVTKKGVQIIEFNARWGDPEAEVILPAIQTDYMDIISAVNNQKLDKTNITMDSNIRISIAGCAAGYPQEYSRVKGKEIFGLEDAMKIPGVILYGAGIKRKGNRYFVDGGRIFHLVAKGKDIKEARKIAYEAMSMIYIGGNNLHYRTDIGWQEIEPLATSD